MNLTTTDGVAVLTICTDAEPYITRDMASLLKEAAGTLQQDTSLHAVILKGGDRIFCAGASEELLLEESGANCAAYFAELPSLLLSFPVPTIAAMSGHAIGGGLIIGLWCDLAILAEESLYAANFMAIGFTPGMGATTVLDDTLGTPLATEMLLTGRMLKGHEIKNANCPLSHAVLPREEVLRRTTQIAQDLRNLPREALLRLKRAMSKKRKRKLDDVVVEERAMHTSLLNQAETRSRIREHFALFNKRKHHGGEQA